MKKILLLMMMMMIGITLNAQQWKWYITGPSQPWGSVSNITAMNQAFGAGQWSQGTFATPAAAIFAPSVCLVYIDGGDAQACAMNNFVTANNVLIQNWVFNGGRLFLNAGPNQCANQNWYFGGTTLNYFTGGGPYSTPGNAVLPPHPIYTGVGYAPSFPVITNTHTGNFYCHGFITGVGLTPIITNTTSLWAAWGGAGQPTGGNIILASKPWGAGLCLFGSMTNTSFHAPNPSATNLRANMLSWLYVCCVQPTITVATTSTVLCTGQSATITGSGAGPGGTYTINPGNIISNTAAVTPSATTIYTVVGTNSANCTGSQTVQIFVNPTPTINPGNDSPICRGSILNLTVNASAGNPVLYNWVGPNSYTSAFQNPQIVNAQPSNTGIYTVNVISTFSNGTCQNSGTTSVFVVNTNSITVSDYTLCQNSQLSLTAGVIGASSYTWTGPNGFTSNIQNPNPISPVTPLNSGDYIVNASFTIPGVSLVCTSSAVSNVSIVGTSPITITLPSNVCQGVNVLGDANAAGSPTFVWQGPNNFTSNNKSFTIPNITPLSSGIYSVTGLWSIGQVTCPISNSQLLDVVGVNDILINNPIEICYPQNFQLTANSQGAISYSWAASNGYTSNIQNPIFGSPTPTANGIYTVTTVYTNSIINCVNSKTTSVLVNPILTFTLPPYQKLCYNSLFNIDGPNGATSYTWTGPNGFTSNDKDLYINPIQNQNIGTYTLEVNLGPCKTANITNVDLIPSITFTNISGLKTICKGDTVSLYVGIGGGSGNYAYNWNPTQYLKTNNGSSHLIKPDGTVYYVVIAWDIACPSNTLVTQVGVEVEDVKQPILNIKSDCEPLCIKLPTSGDDFSSILYDFNSKIFSPGGDICLESGSYNIKMRIKGKNGCTLNTEFKNNPFVVYPKPDNDFTYSPSKINNITENRVIFTPNAVNGENFTHFWFFNGGIDDSYNTDNPIRVYSEPGKYTAVLITSNEWNCLDTTLKVLEVNEGYNVFIPNAFTPNKTGKNDTFHPVCYGVKEYNLSIFDRWGEMLLDNVKNGEWDGTYKGIPVQDGVYVYRIIVTKVDGSKKEFVGHVTLLK
jgi:gliding motility-associated-like protein